MTVERDVWVREVGTRDGLQSIPTIFSTAAKLEWIRLEAAAGVPEIEVGSFVPAKLLPQMADSAEVVAGAAQTGEAALELLVGLEALAQLRQPQPDLRQQRRSLLAGVMSAELVGHANPLSRCRVSSESQDRA